MTALPVIERCDPRLAAQLRDYVNGLAKPPGSLGRMEEIAVRIGAIQKSPRPSAQTALLLVFAGDHGLAEEGVSRYPAAVTTAMVKTFLAGRASANAFARAADVTLRVVDAGIAGDIAASETLVKAGVRRGTRNAAVEPAMTADETNTALARGVALATEAAQEGFDILALGEMGIGNTASAALLMHRLTAVPLEQCVGRGAGHDDEGLAHKRVVLERAAGRSGATEPLHVLAEFGGYEIAMMTGAMLGAAATHRLIVVDGFICTAAALVAARLDPAVLDYCFFAHRSAEMGHAKMLEVLDVQPLLDLQMRLGEGTGAVLAVPLLRAAARLLSEVASLDDVLKDAG